jgi:hypothetical protein
MNLDFAPAEKHGLAPEEQYVYRFDPVKNFAP